MTGIPVSIDGGHVKRKVGGGKVEAELDEPDYGRESILDIARSRTGWLVAFCVGLLLAALVVEQFEGVLEQHVELSFFVPLIMGHGGNTGSQSVTTVIRALALKQISNRDVPRVVLKEAGAGCMMGAVLGLAILGFSCVWSGISTEVGAAVAIALPLVSLWANGLGAFFTLLADRHGFDPAVTSVPLVTTIVDSTGTSVIGVIGDTAPPGATRDGHRHRVLMVSDFFYPNFGGVENHIYQLSQCLLAAGHKHSLQTPGLLPPPPAPPLLTTAAGGGDDSRVYYIPRRPFYAQSTLPTIAGNMRLLRAILVREGITLLHAHQAFSALGIEALVHARTMGYRAVFTDHSLFGFADAASIATNKILKAALSDVNAVICVSHTSRENTVLRACLPPARVSVIPNAAGAAAPAQRQPRHHHHQQQQEEQRRQQSRQQEHQQQQHQQQQQQQQQQKPTADEGGEEDKLEEQPRDGALLPPLTVVALSRLVYRKGIDLLALVIPEVCARHPNVQFVIVAQSGGT
ncbi:phosphatidylinositol glycan, class A [Monoraphidium neglectum]|uniref:Phosphatidylinositol glycan, class A n=1 Tax=Monoraphidium neglectum TaxID=145388 RepID=A0A0D2JFZ3_9CHLO|nr:phosphatidylinositol glycan, class A [Monoraphidium neglectum]KIY98372.1 phosphatidylinositol glycan, class A [Monoraphidium neglectum]|eukprot:XP_013897392.1 phosphatidylinositol glycan, class A [Monoraphidium neglectum]